MLVLSKLSKLLSQIVSADEIRTAILLTPGGELVSFVSHETRPKDDIRVLTGLSSEIWSETKQDGIGMVDSELGRVLVLSVTDTETSANSNPLLLVAVNSTNDIRWDVLRSKARAIANHLAKPVKQMEEKLVTYPASPNSKAANFMR